MSAVKSVEADNGADGPVSMLLLDLANLNRRGLDRVDGDRQFAGEALAMLAREIDRVALRTTALEKRMNHVLATVKLNAIAAGEQKTPSATGNTSGSTCGNTDGDESP